MNSAELKRKAKDQLREHWGIAIITVLVGGLLMGITATLNSRATTNSDLTGISITFDVFSLIFDGFFSGGLCRFLLNFTENNDGARFADLFSQGNVFFKAMGINILYSLIVAVGMILLIVPGVIWGLMFSQAYYILAEDNSKGIIQCFSESKEMMVGNKIDLFVLELSFLGWIILSALTLGIAGLWVEPYRKLTETYFYLSIK